MNINPLLLCDFYKCCHAEQYPRGVVKIVSYLTPRMSRIVGQDKLTMFGLQGFIKEYLIDCFATNFFGRPIKEVLSEYTTLLTSTLGFGAYSSEKIERLHRLGYLPVSIRALPEGSRVNIKVPMFEISNTHPDFPWVTNALETLISCSLWHAMISANVGYEYRQVVNHYYAKTVDNLPKSRALCDFSMRGQESMESAIRSSAGWLLSFVNTATVPAIPWLERNYNCSCSTSDVGFGAVSTEHSVMCSNFAVDGDEVTMVKRLLTQIYPNHNFSMVSDSYDYWNMVNNVIPQCRDEILAHGGWLGIRGDSGDCVDIVTKTVFRLWDMFGGSVNSKGYKVLCPKVKAIYGDAITVRKAIAIFEILEARGFACNNVSLGVGSFSMQCIEQSVYVDDFGDTHTPPDNCDEDAWMSDLRLTKLPVLQPFTRDTFGIAIKATYAEDLAGNPIMIYKNPVTDTENFKRSQRGCCIVTRNSQGDFICSDGHTYSESLCKENQLIEVFRDGLMLKEYTLFEVRSRLHQGSF